MGPLKIELYSFKFTPAITAAWPNWSRRLTTNQEIPGSTPGAVVFLFCFISYTLQIHSPTTPIVGQLYFKYSMRNYEMAPLCQDVMKTLTFDIERLWAYHAQ